MKKRICVLLLGLIVLLNPVLVVSAETGDIITTGTQERANENEVDVDEDIRDELEEQIADEYEEISIGTADEFIEFANNCKLDTWSVNKKVTLTADISLLGKNFDGVPTFGGIFDGKSHTISEVSITKGTSYTSLFSNVQKSGVISNLKVTGTIMPSGDQIIIGGIVADNYGSLRNCSFEGVVSGNDYVGGIVGMNELSGDIRSCTTSGYISGTHFTGGIAGENMGNIYSCTNEAMVNTTNTDTQITVDAMSNLNKVLAIIKNGESSSEEANADVTVSDAGGIAGLSIGIVSNCLNQGKVGYEHVGYNIGGIVGRQSGYIYRCTNNGKILGRKDVGGIVGQAEPYITVDLSSDIAYQLTEAISKLHDIVTTTLNDTKNQSDVITNRLSAIQQFTSGAIEDVRYIADGTVDFANGVSGATSEAFSRVDYILDEASKDGGVIDQTTSAANNATSSAESLKATVNDLGLEQYMSSEDKEKYTTAKSTLESISSQYSTLYAAGYTAYYNKYIDDNKSETASTSDLIFSGTFGTDTSDSSATVSSYNVSGDWTHSEDSASFPVTDTNDSRNSDDQTLFSNAVSSATSSADTYAKTNYTSPVDGNTGDESYYERDLADASAEISSLYTKYMPYMTDAVRADALKSVNSLQSATDNLKNASSETKSIISNVAGKENISFPQFSSEYKAHTTSLSDNMQGMNDNFGLLNSEINNATGVLVDDLQSMSDQFNTIMLLYTDAIDGVLEADYTTNYEDMSLEEAESCTDATIDRCINYGVVSADIAAAGIAGTMAIEYDFDMESDVTGIKDSKLNSSYITKCVLRGNNNYATATSEKSYAGGVCGLQEMGTITGCSNFGNIESASGKYIGGICGSSLSYIVKSNSRGILTAESYVGGIVGDGMHVTDCTSIVKIDDSTSWYGAIAGHVDDEGVVRNNTFVSDELAGIDRVSYSLKAEPVAYDKKELPYDFNSLTVTFVLDEEDDFIKKISKDYGDSLDLEEYPKVEEKEGYYVTWDVEHIDSIVSDEIITASYVKYRTTIGENDTSYSGDTHQGELLVDGDFKDGDVLDVERYVNYKIEDIKNMSDYSELDKYENLKVTIPDDGKQIHKIRFRPKEEYKDFFGEYELYDISEENEKLIEKIDTMADYSIYEIEGNEVELSVRFPNAVHCVTKTRVFVRAVIIIAVIILLLIIIGTKRHGAKLPKIFKKLYQKIYKNISEKAKNKEQKFYDDSNDK